MVRSGVMVAKLVGASYTSYVMNRFALKRSVQVGF